MRVGFSRAGAMHFLRFNSGSIPEQQARFSMEERQVATP